MGLRNDVGFAKRLRTLLFGDQGEAVVRLNRDVEEMRRILRDPATLRPVVLEALRQEVHATPDDIAALLTPVVQELVRQQAMTQAPPPRDLRARRWLPLGVIVLAVCGGGVALTSLKARGPVVSEAAAVNSAESVLTVAAAQVAAEAAGAPAPSRLLKKECDTLRQAQGERNTAMESGRGSAHAEPVEAWGGVSQQPARAVIVEERSDGFGLGDAALSDGELAREVRGRLTGCEELAGASVSFSVKDGWVWLRGETSASGREAAEQALSDLGHGAFVVNQLAVAPSSPEMLAGR